MCAFVPAASCAVRLSNRRTAFKKTPHHHDRINVICTETEGQRANSLTKKYYLLHPELLEILRNSVFRRFLINCNLSVV